MKQPLVSIVVLNWNGLEDTKKCLQSLKKLKYKSVEVIVVDNGSTDGSKEYLKLLKDIEYIDLPQNTGFTGGHIAGFNKSKGDYIALLNNDVVVDPDWLGELLGVFHRHGDAAAVGGKAFLWNKHYPAYVGTNPFYSYQEVDMNQGYTKTLMTGEEECLVDSISGAALIIDKKKLEGVGYLDNNFFAYYEETDLLARLKRKGFNVYYCPTAYVWHKVAASSENGSEGKFYLKQMHRNRYYFAYKNFDNPNLKRFLSSYSREIMRARIKNFAGKGTDTEASCRVEVMKEIKKEQANLKRERQEILRLGKTYNNTLAQSLPTDVTVVIPCYNYAQYVAEAIQSALKQSHSPIKVIVINDGSTDNSLHEINKFKNNPLVEIIDKKNEGVISTKNLGISLSKTYWTMFLDADDVLDEDAITIMLRALKSKGIADVVYSDMKLFGAITDIFRAKPFQPHTFLSQNYINNTTLINTTSLKRTGGYKPAMQEGLEDWELYVTLFEQGARFRYVPQHLVWYRQHGQELLSRNAEMQDIEKGRRLFEVIKTLHPNLYKKYGKRQRLTRIFMKSFYLPIKHPGVIIVVLRSIPSAVKQAIRHVLHNVRMYLYSK